MMPASPCFSYFLIPPRSLDYWEMARCFSIIITRLYHFTISLHFHFRRSRHRGVFEDAPLTLLALTGHFSRYYRYYSLDFMTLFIFPFWLFYHTSSAPDTCETGHRRQTSIAWYLHSRQVGWPLQAHKSDGTRRGVLAIGRCEPADIFIIVDDSDISLSCLPLRRSRHDGDWWFSHDREMVSATTKSQRLEKIQAQ